MLSNGAAWAALGAAHHGATAASAMNTVVTSVSWLGAGSEASALTATMLNAALQGLAAWVDVHPALVSSAVAAYDLAFGAMRTAAECEANRTEWTSDNAINPMVLGALTPRIVSLDTHYFGMMWPNNAAVGASYGATLTTLAASLAVPAPVAGMGASPAAPAMAASAVTQAAGQAAASGGMKAAEQGTSAGTGGTAAAQDAGSQLTSMMDPLQQMMSTVMQAPQGLMQAPQSLMGPAQSAMGMFMNPGGMGGAMEGGVPAGAAGVAGAPGAQLAAAGGGGAGGGGGVPASSFTRPVSAFEPGAGGRPVGLRPSGALGAPEAPRATTSTAGGMGGMPVGHGAAGHGGQQKGGRPSERLATVRVAGERL